MKNPSIVSTILATSVLLAASGISSGAEPKLSNHPGDQTVSAADLNLANDIDVQTLYRRIRSAAISACRADAAVWDVKRVLHRKKCVESAVEEAVTSANMPLLTTIHGVQQPVASR